MKNLVLILIIAFSILLEKTEAQIVYTDVNPDSTVNEFLHGYGVDFNHDDKIDVHLTLLDNVGVWVMLLIPDNDNDEVFVVYDGEEASILEYGDNISSSSNWFQLGSGGWGGLLYGYWENDGEYGNWVDTQTDKYLGIKFKEGSSYYYAWIYLSTIVHDYDDMEFTIQSFAYEQAAGEAIIAGDTGQGVGVDVMEDKSVLFYPNPAKDHIYLNASENIEKISIYDFSGKLLLEKLQPSSVLGLSSIGLSSGFYILEITIDGHISHERLVIDK